MSSSQIIVTANEESVSIDFGPEHNAPVFKGAPDNPDVDELPEVVISARKEGGKYMFTISHDNRADWTNDDMIDFLGTAFHTVFEAYEGRTN